MTGFTKRFLGLIVLSLVLVGGAAGAEAGWRPLTGPDSSYVIDVPGDPDPSESDVTGEGPRRLEWHIVFVDVGRTTYVIQTGVYPADADMSDPTSLLNDRLTGLRRRLVGGDYSSVEWISHKSSPAVDAIGEMEGMAIRSFSVLKGRRVINLVYVGPKDTARSPEAERFIGSLTPY